MFDLARYLDGLAVLLGAALAIWAASVAKRDASIVDAFWGPMFVLATLAYAWPLADLPPRGVLVLVLVAAWALRLCVYIVARSWGHGEDYRYREIRRRNQPNFALKSVYLVFGLQAMLAWLISLPLLAAQTSPVPLHALDAAGAALVVLGLAFESIADLQLARFKRDPANRGQVLDRGLWRYSRHPNYFGEACVWWGFGLIGLAAGGWWSLVSSVLMTWLLVRVSGVALLEQTIVARRPAYAAYARKTSAFVPWPRRKLRRGDAVVDYEV
jgi:steroid 5-alpha reductase family enzyme